MRAKAGPLHPFHHMIAASDAVASVTHVAVACTSTRHPTLRTAATDNPAPIRKIAPPKPPVATVLMIASCSPTAGTSVRVKLASRKPTRKGWTARVHAPPTPPEGAFVIHTANTVHGKIHTTRDNFTTIAVSRAALLPYAAPAPATDAMSCTATPTHVPYCVSVSPKPRPTSGNTANATALRMKIAPVATAIDVDDALMADPTAAIADPPQIAVPELTRSVCSRPTPSNRPSPKPTTIAPTIVAAAKTNPLDASRHNSPRSILNPSSTMHVCIISRDTRLDASGNRDKPANAVTTPTANATGGGTNVDMHAASSRR
jgi:hypothetical protein